MCSNSPARSQPRGLSLVEVMVGLVVGLLVSLAAAHTAMLFMAQQRQGLGVGGTVINAAGVMSALRDDLGMVGLGFFGDSRYLCNSLNFSRGATVWFNGGRFAPLQVTREAAGDTLDVFWGTQVESGANVRLRATSDGSSAALNSYLPVAANDAVLMSPASPTDPTPCLVRTVTAVTASTTTAPQVLGFANSGMHNQVAFPAHPGFDESARITGLGTLNWTRYRVVAGSLLLERPLTGTSAVIARDVVSFRIQYGVAAAAAGSTSLEDWVDPTGAFASLNNVNLPRVRAVRIGLISRSPQPEKPDADGVCTATVTRPVLWGGTAENLNNPDWQCFRYRTSTLVVPLRNFVLGLR